MERRVDKKSARLRRARKARSRIGVMEVSRLSVHRTPRHIYAQLFSPDGARVLASASSLDPVIRGLEGEPDKKAVATAVGRLIAERCHAAGVTKVAFDRAGYRYHGRVKALADAARAQGLEF
jgi:large subunit ribosomal protein L18